MKLILLIVLFSTPENRLPHQMAGWGPRQADTLQACLVRRSKIQTYLEANAAPHVYVHAACIEFEARGYKEAEDALIRKAGVPG